MKFGIVVFPGSNCDQDMYHVLSSVMGCDTEYIWHKETKLEGYSTKDCIILPGGFSYGDHLRSGAIASHSPIIQEVKKFANKGGFVFGICNGFQILCETGLLPGTLLHNDHGKFLCKNVTIKSVTNDSPLTCRTPNQALNIPIAHAEGRYYIDKKGYKELESQNQILFKYCDKDGTVDTKSNPNGSLANIAGISNKNKNVFGMMPHPERASEAILGNKDGVSLFESLINCCCLN